MRIGKKEDLFISDAARAIYDVWLKLPRETDQICPKRFELDLEALPEKVSQHCFILAYLGDSVLSVAYAGSAIDAFLGSKLEGQNVLLQRTEEQRPIEMRYYDAVFGQPCAGKMVRRSRNIVGNEANFNSMHLPLLDYRNEVRYLLGVVAITDREAPASEDAQNVYGTSVVLDQVLVDIGAETPLLERQ